MITFVQFLVVEELVAADGIHSERSSLGARILEEF